jgi:hypothetical protein
MCTAKVVSGTKQRPFMFNIVIHPACVVFSVLYNNNNNNMFLLLLVPSTRRFLLIIDLFVVVIKRHVSAFLPSSGFSCY